MSNCHIVFGFFDIMQFSLLRFVVILYDPDPQGRFATERRASSVSSDHLVSAPTRWFRLGAFVFQIEEM